MAGTRRELSVVWFKRDLRLHDHAPLAHGVARGGVICLYVIEPSLWAQPDQAARHYAFLRECLLELDDRLRRLGGALRVELGEATQVLARLHAQTGFDQLLSHEETGNAHTYARDRAVARWCRAAGVQWREWPQHGVVRALRGRDGWSERWRARMQAPQLAAPAALHAPAALAPTPAQRLPRPAELGLQPQDCVHGQRGGRAAGLRTLESFLEQRSAGYRGGISSPLRAPGACSRLSPYLAWGCLSLREVVQATERRMDELGGVEHAARQRQGLGEFVRRLHWHCHFMQKLESEPAIEFRNMHRGYDGLREGDWNDAHFAALVDGRTGWPMVDACVAMLRETGWLNFRMRAMLVSVAAYPLWLHWREVGLWLARQFLDYEPGIHWSQMQMQSGTTGINTTRVYNPVKQARDHDPQGRFVRRWIPAMRQVPDAWLFEPWRMPAQVQQRCGVRIGDELPAPAVDLEAATRAARARVHALRAQAPVRAARAEILERHGSRLRPGDARAKRGAAGASARQLSLEF